MITVSQIAAAAVRDYYARMAAVSKDRSYWFGHAAGALGYGLGDAVDPDVLYALCALGPRAAKGLAAGNGVSFAVGDIEAHQAELERARIPGYDLTFSAPKSISLAYLAHPDEPARQAVATAHRLAVNAALAFLEEKAGLTRITVAGEVEIARGKLAFAGFTHYTNRNVEPHLHTHVILPNLVLGSDGRWRSLHARELYRWYMAAGALYRAALREHMARLTDAKWAIEPDGWRFDIAGLSAWRGPDGAELLKAFSLRHAEISDLRAKLEENSPDGTLAPRVRRSLAVRTRRAKDFGDGDARIEEVAEELRTRLAESWGLGDASWREILGTRDDPGTPEERPGKGLWLRIPAHLGAYGEIPDVCSAAELACYLARILFDQGGGGSREGVLSGKAYVSIQDVHAAAYNLLGGFVAREALDEAVGSLLAGAGNDPSLRLVPLVPALYAKGEQVAPSRAPIRFYATAGVLNSEARVIDLASRKTAAGILDRATVDAYLAEQADRDGFALANEQREALRHLFTSTTAATLLMGAQGSGKTTLFRHFARLAASAGQTVWGLGPQGTAVGKLGETLRSVDKDARSMTIESFVAQVGWGSLRLPENACLILDESSQVDTLELAEVLEIVAGAGAKLILVGDDRQLGSVRYGGMFATLFATLGGARMVETRRAADPLDRTAQAYLRMGDLKGAIRLYGQAGRITVADDGLAATEIVSEWLGNEFEAGSDSFVITATVAEEQAANALAHEAWDRHRTRWMQKHLDGEVRHHRLSPKERDAALARLEETDPAVATTFAGAVLELRMGDAVAIRRNARIGPRARLVNGERGHVTGITATTVTLFLQDGSSARHVRIPRKAIEDTSGLLSYGWASTVFRTQSMELGTPGASLRVLDTDGPLVRGTPVAVSPKRGRQKALSGTVEATGESTVAVRLEDGRIRRFDRQRVSASADAARLIGSLEAGSREGNALVIGAERMSLDALLVAASRARERTDFVFRSVMDTETDLGGERLLAEAGDEAVAAATMALYLARQARGEEPDSAYLRLAREREAITLATSAGLNELRELRAFLGENLTAGRLRDRIETSTAAADRDRHLGDAARLEDRLTEEADPEVQAHLAAQLDEIDAQIAYAEAEMARMELFRRFLGHATEAMAAGDGEAAVDERYVRERIALVDDAIEMAEGMEGWTEIGAGCAIAVPLPENTEREIVDTSAERLVEIDATAGLFSSVSYRSASSWMRVAESLYERMLATGATADEAVAAFRLPDAESLRLREAVGAVAIMRAHPAQVGHPVTLRTLAKRALAMEADADLVAAVEQMAESEAERKARRAEREAMDEFVPGDDDLPDDSDLVWETGDDAEAEDTYWVPEEDDAPAEAKAPEAESEAEGTGVANVPPAGVILPGGETRTYHRGFFYRDGEGKWVVDSWRYGCYRHKAAWLSPTAEQMDYWFNLNRRIEIVPGEFYEPRPPRIELGAEDVTLPSGETRTYHRGFFYKDGEGKWVADAARRSECLREVEELLPTREEFHEWFNLNRRIEIVPGEFYEPPEAPKTKPKRRKDRNAGYDREGRDFSKEEDERPSRGYGYGGSF